MEQLFGNNLIILYFIVGLSVICYTNFKTQQRVMLMYMITYACCFLDILDTKIALIVMTFLLFIYLEYLTEDYYKLKIIRKIRYKVMDAIFLVVVQYYYWIFVIAVLLQTDYVKTLFGWKYYGLVCVIFSVLLAMICVHNTSVQRFELCQITDIMEIINKNPVYKFPFDKIDESIYRIITTIEDKSYFVRKNSYNFFSVEFIRYKLSRFKCVLKNYHGKEKVKCMTKAFGHYVLATKHIRGYSTIEIQLIRNIGLNNGYNCVVKRKIFEVVYTKIFFGSLKDFFIDNYYSNRNHYKEYLLWLYFRVVKTKINGSPVHPVSKAFCNDKMETWSKEGFFIACMGLSGKGKSYFFCYPYYNIIIENGINEKKVIKMYNAFGKQKLS